MLSIRGTVVALWVAPLLLVPMRAQCPCNQLKRFICCVAPLLQESDASHLTKIGRCSLPGIGDLNAA